MPEHQGGERFEIVLEAQKSDVPPVTRLKGLLKAALRTWGLRCVSVAQEHAGGAKPTSGPVAAADAPAANVGGP
jgi:hypothetical protein